MLTFIVVVICALACLQAELRYRASARVTDRRARAQWGWAMLGGGVGSFFGLAGMGSAIAGTVPGAVVGYLFAGYLMLKREAGEEVGPTRDQTLQAARLAGQVTGVAAAATGVGLGWLARKLLAALVWLVPFFLLGVLVLVWTENREHRQLPALPVAQPGAAAAPSWSASPRLAVPPQPLTAEERARAEFEDAVVAVESRYPALNEKSSSYSAAKAAAVEARIGRFLEAGMRPRDAVNAAVFQIMEAPKAKSAVRSSNQNGSAGFKTPDKPACEYKGVMSDDDYRNCGIRPPGP